MPRRNFSSRLFFCLARGTVLYYFYVLVRTVRMTLLMLPLSASMRESSHALWLLLLLSFPFNDVNAHFVSQQEQGLCPQASCESPRVGTGTATGIGGSAAGGIDGSGRAAVGGAAASGGGTNATAAPFVFGATTSGATATATATFGGSIGTGGFRFGGAEDRKEESKGGFNFGITEGGFSFGKIDKSSAEAPKPSRFSFPNPKETKDDEPKPESEKEVAPETPACFSFGIKPPAKSEPPKFSFGVTPAVEPPKFSFGPTSAAGPFKSSFNATTAAEPRFSNDTSGRTCYRRQATERGHSFWCETRDWQVCHEEARISKTR